MSLLFRVLGQKIMDIEHNLYQPCIEPMLTKLSSDSRNVDVYV